MSNKVTLTGNQLPHTIRGISQPPKQLFVQSGYSLDELCALPRVAIVGSRKVSAYGRAVTAKFASELAANGVVIISGLAIGVDAIAHQATLDAGGRTIAVLPTSLEKIYPASHAQLARAICAQGGALISEYEHAGAAFKGNFVNRNRLIAGLADVVLITEAAEASGSLHTARFARAEQKPLFTVPGQITSHTSTGTNQLIQSGDAKVALNAQDILQALGVVTQITASVPTGDTPAEQTLITLLKHGTHESAVLLAESKLDTRIFGQTMTMLEIKGVIKHSGSDTWTLA